MSITPAEDEGVRGRDWHSEDVMSCTTSTTQSAVDRTSLDLKVTAKVSWIKVLEMLHLLDGDTSHTLFLPSALLSSVARAKGGQQLISTNLLMVLLLTGKPDISTFCR